MGKKWRSGYASILRLLPGRITSERPFATFPKWLSLSFGWLSTIRNKKNIRWFDGVYAEIFLFKFYSECFRGQSYQFCFRILEFRPIASESRFQFSLLLTALFEISIRFNLVFRLCLYVTSFNSSYFQFQFLSYSSGTGLKECGSVSVPSWTGDFCFFSSICFVNTFLDNPLLP